MAHIKPKGSFVALVTPMNEDGSIDFEGFRTLLNWHEQNGTEAVLIMGSTGEVSMLTQEERRAIISETAKMKTGKRRCHINLSMDAPGPAAARSGADGYSVPFRHGLEAMTADAESRAL